MAEWIFKVGGRADSPPWLTGRKMMRIVSLAALVGGVLLACAPPSTARTTRDPNVITRDEILASHATTAYDAVNRLRPSFLQYHGQTTITGSDPGYPRVYLDHMPFGDINSLKTLDTNGILEIRFYNGADASSRFGLGNVSGAIEVISSTRQ
jgi:hypothetical protein